MHGDAILACGMWWSQGGSEVQSQPWVHKELEVCMGRMIPCLTKKKKKTKKKNKKKKPKTKPTNQPNQTKKKKKTTVLLVCSVGCERGREEREREGPLGLGSLIMSDKPLGPWFTSVWFE